MCVYGSGCLSVEKSSWSRPISFIGSIAAIGGGVYWRDMIGLEGIFEALLDRHLGHTTQMHWV